ncbi:MAG TPA: hypothetical protein VFM80_11490 [Gracilimonas sp.]|uniref:hypothetical protein n=1 Tax=Gracilimonas sp. TaxID=1974203 RepID=UPI002D95DCB5|nr:hypothetical protein [Gracilimonas sp.]
MKSNTITDDELCKRIINSYVFVWPFHASIVDQRYVSLDVTLLVKRTEDIKILKNESDAQLLVRHIERFITDNPPDLAPFTRLQVASQINNDITVLIGEEEAKRIFDVSDSNLALLRKLHGIAYIKTKRSFQYSWRDLKEISQKIKASPEL